MKVIAYKKDMVLETNGVCAEGMDIEKLGFIIQAIPLDKVKKAREDIWKNVYEYSGSGNEVTQAYCDGFKDSLAIIDKLLESEEK